MIDTDPFNVARQAGAGRTATRLMVREDYDDDAGDQPNCVSATPGPNGNVPITACNSYYNYDPQFAPAVAVAVIFGIFMGIHIFESIFFRKKHAWVVIMGVAWETLAFAIHALGAKDQQQIGYATAWNILFLLAPLWINAFVYMTFARMVHYWHPTSKVLGIRARVISKSFVWADIITFIIQAAGLVMTSPGASASIIQTGLNIYMGGVGLQQFFIAMFCCLMIAFQKAGNRARDGYPNQDGKRSWKPLLFALYGTLLCITTRIIFRIAEYARGITPENPLPFHEAYTYALDCFPMMIALLIVAIYHPGRYLIGPDSEFHKKSRKQKKAEKAENNRAKRDKKEAGRIAGGEERTEDY